VRRPVVVRRSVPQRPGFGRHRPTRPPVTRQITRWVDQARRMNQRGGSRGPRSRLSDTRSSPLPGVPGVLSGPERAVGTRRSLEPSCRARDLIPQRQSTGDGRAVRPESGRPAPAHPTSPATSRAYAGVTSGPGRTGVGRGTVPVMAVSGTDGSRLWRCRLRRRSRWSVRTWTGDRSSHPMSTLSAPQAPRVSIDAVLAGRCRLPDHIGPVALLLRQRPNRGRELADQEGQGWGEVPHPCDATPQW
jgi:hypothetical protein